MPLEKDDRAPRKLQMWNCTFCRNDKKKCNPQPRTWPQKCDRCEKLDLSCTEPMRKNRRRGGKGSRGKKVDGCAQIHARNALGTPPSTSDELVSSYSGNEWDMIDLSNAVAMLQLATAEFVELERACHAATQLLPKPYSGQSGSLRTRLDRLTSLIDDLCSALRSRIAARLETEADGEARGRLKAAATTLLDPMSGMGVVVEGSEYPIACRRPAVLQDGVVAEGLLRRAGALAPQGKRVEALVVYSKSLASAKQRPSLDVVRALKMHEMPDLMASTATKFGLPEPYAKPSTWAHPSMLHPSFPQATEEASLGVVLIKNWLGHSGALALSHNCLPRGSASLSAWKAVFRSVCLKSPRPIAGLDGYTSLHLATMLDMVDEVRFYARPVDADLGGLDRYGHTALHLAAMSGKQDLCAALVQSGNRGSDVLARDWQGRTPVWYAAERGKEVVFRRLLDATLRFGNMVDLCAQRDAEGQTLAQYAAGRGLDGGLVDELWAWTAWEWDGEVMLGIGEGDGEGEVRLGCGDEVLDLGGNGLSPWAARGVNQ